MTQPTAKQILMSLIGEGDPATAKLIADRIAPQESGHVLTAKQKIEAALQVWSESEHNPQVGRNE